MRQFICFKKFESKAFGILDIYLSEMGLFSKLKYEIELAGILMLGLLYVVPSVGKQFDFRSCGNILVQKRLCGFYMFSMLHSQPTYQLILNVGMQLQSLKREVS